MRLQDRIVAHPWLTILIGALLMVPALDRLVDFKTLQSKLPIDPSIEALLPRGGPALEVFERTRERYGSDDVLLVAWIADDLFTPEHLAGLKRFTRRIERLAGVANVDSLATAPNVHATADSTEVDAFLHVLPENRAAAERIRDEALANPLLVGQLVAKDGRGVLVAVHFDRTLDTSTLTDLVKRISEESRAEAGDMANFVTGPVVLRLEVGRLLLHDLYRIMPLAVLATLLVAAIGFRSVRGLLLPFLANSVALIATLACFAAAGHTLNFLTVILPPVVYVVGFAYSIHVVSEFDHEFARGLERAQAVRTALREVFMPLTLTAFTAAIGFSSLAISGIDSIRQFGLYATLGTLLGWASALTLVPAGLMLLPANRPHRARPPRRFAFAPWLADFNLRHRRLLLAIGAVLAVASIAASSRIEVSTDYLSSFADDSPVRRDFQRVGAVFAGAVPIEILIESDIPQAFKEPAQLRALADLKTWLLTQPEIGGVYTLADYIGILYRALAPDMAARSALPDSVKIADQLLLFGSGTYVNHFSDPSFKSTLVHVQSTAVRTSDLIALATRIEARLKAQLPAHLHGQVTGSSYVIAETIDNITQGQIQSLTLAFAVIYVLLIILFGSARIAALALLPTALPIVVYFGILGAASITLNLTTSLVADVVLGIAIDETIHFLSRFNDEARRAANERDGVAAALATVIRPATFTTAALCVGFLALTAGELQNQVQFGLLSAIILFIAWLLNFTFTPALTHQLRFVTLWEILTVDLGAAPHKSIPLFAGLSERQARIAALMGRIETCATGTRLVEQGDEAHEICVIIDGELLASVRNHEGQVVPLRKMRRGALIGEVALFTGRRSANVDSLSSVRVLWLTQASLERIRKRYPRIAARLYLNIGAVLAERLDDLTGNVNVNARPAAHGAAAPPAFHHGV